MSELPKGWAQATLADLGDWSSGGTPSRSMPEYFDGDIPFVKTGDLADTWLSSVPENISQIGLQNSSAKLFPEGTLLVAMYGATIGKTARLSIEAATNQACAALLGNDANGDALDYVWAYLRSQLENLKASGKGGAQPNISQTLLKSYPIPLPPLSEQQRIVRKLDTLSARTATARTHLTAIANLVDRYRQQLFEIAFEGGLTEDMREERDGQSTGDQILPLGWDSMTLGEISEIQGGIQVGKKRPADVELVEVPYLRVANVQRGWLNLDEIKTISVTPQEKERLLLQDGDILMNEGGDRDKLGRGWIWRAEVAECIHQNHVFRIRLLDTGFPSEFVSHYANAMGQRYFFDEGKQTTNLASISKTKVSSLPIPIPPVSEAVEIVRRIDATFAKINRLAAEAEKALKQTDRLDQRILAKAFAGELVPQDPKDEPANVLLGRVREARAKTPKKTRPRRTKANAMKKDPKDLLLADSAKWPENGVTSEELAKRVVIPHSDLRDALFDLLGGSKPQLEQVFDKTEERMRLKRVAQ